MTTHDFKAALTDYTAYRECTYDGNGFDFIQEHGRAIKAALLIAEKVMAEPSEAMLEKHEVALIECFPAERGAYLTNAAEVFKAMRDEMLKEIGQ